MKKEHWQLIAIFAIPIGILTMAWFSAPEEERAQVRAEHPLKL